MQLFSCSVIEIDVPDQFFLTCIQKKGRYEFIKDTLETHAFLNKHVDRVCDYKSAQLGLRKLSDIVGLSITVLWR